MTQRHWRCERCGVPVTGTRCPTCRSMPEAPSMRRPMTREMAVWLQWAPGGLGPLPGLEWATDPMAARKALYRKAPPTRPGHRARGGGGAIG